MWWYSMCFTKLIYHDLLRKRKVWSKARLFVDANYRNDIVLLFSHLSKRRFKAQRALMKLKDINFSHDINYPDWVEKLKKKIDKGGNIPDIKVTNIEGKWMVVDGNHRLAAMKEILSEDTKVPVKKLI
jgi:hypothetical protein